MFRGSHRTGQFLRMTISGLRIPDREQPKLNGYLLHRSETSSTVEQPSNLLDDGPILDTW